MKFRGGSDGSFLDAIFNYLGGILACFMLAILLINPVAKQHEMKKKADYIIILEWGKGDNVDLDLWVSNPAGEVVSFKNRDRGSINLDRDDTGDTNDFILENGKKVTNPINKEVATIRQTVPGEYHINVHYYRSNMYVGKTVVYEEIPFTIQLVRLNPRYEELFKYEGMAIRHNHVDLVKILEVSEDKRHNRMLDSPTNLVRKFMIGEAHGDNNYPN